MIRPAGRKFHCSELVVFALKCVGWAVSDQSSENYLPGHLSSSWPVPLALRGDVTMSNDQIVI